MGSLERHPQLPYLASASADGTIGLWFAEADGYMGDVCGMESMLVVRTSSGGASGGPVEESPEASREHLDIPSCVAWVPTDVTKVISGYTSSRVALFDVRREAQVLDLFPGETHGATPSQ